jgi:hypothetical protein
MIFWICKSCGVLPETHHELYSSAETLNKAYIYGFLFHIADLQIGRVLGAFRNCALPMLSLVTCTTRFQVDAMSQRNEFSDIVNVAVEILFLCVIEAEM